MLERRRRRESHKEKILAHFAHAILAFRRTLRFICPRAAAIEREGSLN
jgi:hypothetical protein